MGERDPNPILFVYGTLRRGAKSTMRASMQQHARWLGPATMRGALYRIGWYPGFVPDPSGAPVRGDLFEILSPGLLAELDEFEECTARHPAPHEYVRERGIALLADGSTRRVWFYRYQRPVDAAARIHGGDFLADPSAPPD